MYIYDFFLKIVILLYYLNVNPYWQNDFMELFKKDSDTGKTGTDIQLGKCTWLAVNFLQRCSAGQRQIFYESYGRSDPEHVARIRKIYRDMSFTEQYEEDQRKRYERFMKQVQDLPPDTTPSPELFLRLLNIVQSEQ